MQRLVFPAVWLLLSLCLRVACGEAPMRDATAIAADEANAPDPVDRFVTDIKKPLADFGLTPALRIVGDLGKNTTGGLSTHGHEFISLTDFSLTLDTETMFNLKGGTAFVDFQFIEGQSASVDAGDFQNVSTLDAFNQTRTQISEAWYQQKFVDANGEERLRIKAGKIDANFDFAYSPVTIEFVNASIVWTATNQFMPTYPDPAFGAEAFVRPANWLYIGAGLFDGAFANGIRTGSNGPRTLWQPPGSFYAISESGITWTTPRDAHQRFGGAGRFALGGWYQGGDLNRFDGTTQNGAGGWYAMFEQMLWRERPEVRDDPQGVAMYAIFDHADGDVLPADDHFAAGVTWTGAIERRNKDVIGLGVTWIHFSKDAGFGGPDETTIEGFYKIQLRPWLSIKPDVQYILNPSGSLPDALVAVIRIEMNF